MKNIPMDKCIFVYVNYVLLAASEKDLQHSYIECLAGKNWKQVTQKERGRMVAQLNHTTP